MVVFLIAWPGDTPRPAQWASASTIQRGRTSASRGSSARRGGGKRRFNTSNAHPRAPCMQGALGPRTGRAHRQRQVAGSGKLCARPDCYESACRQEDLPARPFLETGYGNAGGCGMGCPDNMTGGRGQEEREAPFPVSYTHLRAHETSLHLVCRLLLEKKK